MNLFLFIFIIHAALCAATASSTCESETWNSPETWDNFQFDSSVVPVRYNLLLNIDLRDDSFTGNISITVNNTQFSDYFVLNAEGLNISETSVRNRETNAELVIRELFVYKPKQVFVILLREEAEPATYEIRTAFSGLFQDDSVGLYKAEYTTDGRTKCVVAMNLLPNFARRVFPCFDDPRFKAVMQVTLRHEGQWVALSSMPIEKVTIQRNGMSETSFAASPPMAPQSVGFVIGEFSHITITHKQGSMIQMYDRSKDLQTAEHSLKIAKKAIKTFEVYFGIDYPLPKLDIIALPAGVQHFTSWGLTSTREYQSSENPFKAARHLYKEIAKMWIGHFVTMATREDQWVVEALAGFLSGKALEVQQPASEWEEYLLSDILSLGSYERRYDHQREVGEDGEENVTANEPSVRDILFFKSIEDFSEEMFRAGISKFLKKFFFGSPAAVDLWNELSVEMGFDVTRLLDASRKVRKTYPIINVLHDDKVPHRVFLEQKYVLLLPERALVNISSHGFSSIPITFFTSKDRRKRIVEMGFYSKYVEENAFEWIKFNINFTGLYLINYEIKDWKRFISLLNDNHKVLSPSDRANLLHDAYTLAESGVLPWSVLLEMAPYLRFETDLAPWETASRIFRRMELLQKELAFEEPLQQFLLWLSEDIYQRTAWINHSDLKLRKLSRIVTELQCRHRSQHCLNKAMDGLRRLMKDGEVKPYLRRFFCVYGSHAMKELEAEETWNFMLFQYQNVSEPEEKFDLLFGLTSFLNTTKLESLFQLFNGTQKEMLLVIQLMSQNIAARDMVCHRNCNRCPLTKRFSSEETRLAAIKVLASVCTDDDLLLAVQDKETSRQVDELSEKKQEAIRVAERNTMLYENPNIQVKQWLTSHLNSPWSNERLPSSVVPLAYNVTLETDLASDSFKGNVSITVNITEPISCLLIHSEQLDITNSEILYADTGKNVAIKDQFESRMNSYWVIRFENNIPEDIYILRYEFIGRYVKSTTGFVKHHYVNTQISEKRNFVYTKFEPSYARRAFPCFDEPHFKAKFRVTVVHNSEYTALSNMPEESRDEREDGLTETRFSESLLMSTYLVSVVVSDFDYTEGELKNKERLRYFAPPDRINGTLHSMEMIPKFLEKLDAYCRIPFSYPKLDFVAIPDYPGGGMENWGLIYIAGNKLIDNSTETWKIFESDKTVAHELAHHWFGNLVTVRWWDDIWLNEGFSNLAAHQALVHFYPEEADEFFVRIKTNIIQREIGISRPLIKEVAAKTHEIRKRFDWITYNKGYAIGSMLQSALGVHFHIGLTNYLKKYSFKNARTEDLWNEWTTALGTGLNLSAVMETWTRETQYPYVEIKRQWYGFTAKQTAVEAKYETEERISKKIWSIPLMFKNFQTGEECTYWLTEEEGAFPLDDSDGACIKFNPDFKGYYILKYDEQDYDCLSRKLEEDHNMFSPMDRYNLLYEANYLLERNLLSIKYFLKLTRYLRFERSYFPWSIFRTFTFKYIKNNIDENDETFSLWKKYLIYLTDEFYDENGVEGNHSKKLSSTIDALSSFSGRPRWIQMNLGRLESWLQGESPITARNVMPHIQNVSIWQELWDNAWNSNLTNSVKQSYLRDGLIQYKDEILLNMTLTRLLTDENIDKNSLGWSIREFADNPHGPKLLWEYLKEQPKHAINKLGKDNLEALFEALCRAVRHQEEIKNVRRILRCYQHVVENLVSCTKLMNDNIMWISANKPIIDEWLRVEAPI